MCRVNASQSDKAPTVHTFLQSVALPNASNSNVTTQIGITFIIQSPLPNDLLCDLVEAASTVLYDYELQLSREAREQIIECQYAPILELLISKGAPVNGKNISGVTALEQARTYQIPILVHVLTKYQAS